MIEGWEALPVVDIGWGTLVLLLVWMVFTGRLVTRREADAKDRQIELLWQANEQHAKANEAFREAIETNNALIQAVMLAAHSDGDR